MNRSSLPSFNDIFNHPNALWVSPVSLNLFKKSSSLLGSLVGICNILLSEKLIDTLKVSYWRNLPSVDGVLGIVSLVIIGENNLIMSCICALDHGP